MTYQALEHARVRKHLLLLSAMAWVLLLNGSDIARMPAHCPTMSAGAMPLSASFRMLLTMNPPASLAAGWALMLVAMMPPVLMAPVLYIRLCSFAHRRARSTALFITGYAAIWMALGGVLVGIELAVKSIALPRFVPAAGVVLLALIWQFSPVKQRCLNRCHAHPNLAAFGFAADFDALSFGVTHGIWCAGSCWALMLCPMLLPHGHIAAMAGAAALIFSERLEQAMPPCWRWRGLGKVTRIVVAQAQIRLHALQVRRVPSTSGA